MLKLFSLEFHAFEHSLSSIEGLIFFKKLETKKVFDLRATFQHFFLVDLL